MAIELNGTGPVVTDVTRYGTSHNTYAFCSPVLACADAYQDVNTLEFGVPLSELVIVNLGTKALAFQWAGQSADCGVVPAGGMVQFRHAMKSGVSLRCAESGSSTKAAVYGV